MFGTSERRIKGPALANVQRPGTARSGHPYAQARVSAPSGPPLTEAVRRFAGLGATGLSPATLTGGRIETATFYELTELGRPPENPAVLLDRVHRQGRG